MNLTVEPEEFLVVLVTCPDAEKAAAIGRTVVEERLAACVNMVPGLRSIYVWEGKVCDDAEVLCLIKTRRALFERLRARLLTLHPYEVPEVIALPLAAADGRYLAWLQGSTAA